MIRAKNARKILFDYIDCTDAIDIDYIDGVRVTDHC